MDDRLTDAELGEMVGTADADRRDQGVAGWRQVQGERILALIAEVREHRAAMTLTDDERKWVDLWRGSSAARELLAIIDRITEGDDDE